MNQPLRIGLIRCRHGEPSPSDCLGDYTRSGPRRGGRRSLQRQRRAAGDLAAGRGLLSAVGMGGFAMQPQEYLSGILAPTHEEEQAEVISGLDEDYILRRFAASLL